MIELWWVSKTVTPLEIKKAPPIEPVELTIELWLAITTDDSSAAKIAPPVMREQLELKMELPSITLTLEL